jgi:6-phosphogluconolactonase
MAWIDHDYPDPEAMVSAVARQLHGECAQALASRGRATMALAGGRTPLPVYRRLAQQALDWSKVSAVPTDERCVPHGHAACNVREIRAAFAAAAGISIDAITPANGDPDGSLAVAKAVLENYPDSFDIVVLGMGLDGHTASLFPGAESLPLALDPYSGEMACRIDPVPLPDEAPYPRISLTVARLRRARAIHLLLNGQAKREVLAKARARTDQTRYPIGAILHAPGHLLHIHWSP